MRLTKQTISGSITTCILMLAAVGVPAGATDDREQGEPGLSLDASLVSLNSVKGKELLAKSDARESFIPLMMHFTTQNNTAYCGAASSAMVLNASEIERPVSPDHAPFHLFTQTSLFTPAVKKIIEPEQCRRSGMTLAVLGEVLKTFPVDVEVTYAKKTTVDDFRRVALHTLRSSDSFLIVKRESVPGRVRLMWAK